MLCVPELSEEVVKLALCVVALTGPVPRTVAPSLKVTVPLGEPPNAGVTVAVKVTLCPCVEGFSDEAKALVVFAFFTVCVNTDEVLAL